MSARIIELAAYREQRSRTSETPAESEFTELKANVANRFHFWTGASGKRYVHTVYELLECPALPAANYVLVRREPGARRQILSIGRVSNSAPSLNLAEIRQRGAGMPVLLVTYGYSEGMPVDTIECDGLLSSALQTLDYIVAA